MRVGVLAVATFGTLAVGSGLAQSPPKLLGNGGSTPGSLGWLTMPSVQGELKLTPEQAHRSLAISRELREKEDWTRKTVEHMPRQEQLKVLVALSDNQYQEGMKALATFLKPEQVERFDQIHLQRRGAAALLEPDRKKDLKLTEVQAKQIQEVVREGRSEQSKILQASRGVDPKTLEEKVRDNARGYNARAVDLLDEVQKKTWTLITGPPFEKKPGEVVRP